MLQQSSQIGRGKRSRRAMSTVRTLGWNSVLAVCFCPNPPAICTKNANENVSAYVKSLFQQSVDEDVDWNPKLRRRRRAGDGDGMELNENAATGHRLPSGWCPGLVSVGWEMIDRRASISQKCYCQAFDSWSIAGQQVL